MTSTSARRAPEARACVGGATCRGSSYISLAVTRCQRSRAPKEVTDAGEVAVGPIQITGVVLVVLLLAIAGHASFGRPGLAIGLVIGIVLAFGVVRLLKGRE